MIEQRASCEIDAVNRSFLLLRLCAMFAVNRRWNINVLNPVIFAYDENGLRTQKTYNSTTATNYYYNGSVLMGMVTGTGTTAVHQLFSYDASGNVVSVDYSSDGGSTFATYYYVRNAQNDVVKLIDGSGNAVVEYTYDTWGKLLSTTGSLASTLGANQPFRYRGYVYDTETDWYYLQSRYYDPLTCRFISADVFLSTGQGVLGHNAFAYCLNNPVNLHDPCGSKSIISSEQEYGDGFIAYTDSGTGRRYVFDQDDPRYADLPFGLLGTIGDNGCGVVALYNVLVGAGLTTGATDFADIYNEYPYCYGFCLMHGVLGANPNALYVALCGIFGLANVDPQALNSNGGYDAMIGLYFWKNSKGEIGAHYFAAINDGNGTYTVYNDGSIHSGRWVNVMSDAHAAGYVVAVWGINFD